MTTIRGTETLEEALVNGLASVKPGATLVKLVDIADHVGVAVVKVASDVLEVKGDTAPFVGETIKELVGTPAAFEATEGDIVFGLDAVGRIAHGKPIPVSEMLPASPLSSSVMLIVKELEFPLI